jgi:hypothetical protein
MLTMTDAVMNMNKTMKSINVLKNIAEVSGFKRRIRLVTWNGSIMRQRENVWNPRMLLHFLKIASISSW